MVIFMEPSKRVKSINLSEIRKMFEIAGENSINLGLGEPDFKTPDHIIEAASAAMRNGFTHYTSNMGIPELREAISKKLKLDNGIQVSPESVLVTVGASEAIYMSMQALIDPGDEVLIPDPGFLSYNACVSLAGGIPKGVQLKMDNNLRMTIDDVQESINNKTKAIIINSPSNPTGSVMEKEDIQAISEIAGDHDIYLISDEVYEKIIYDTTHHSPAKYCDNAITINGLSKSYAMTGFRIGYVAANPEIIEELLKIHQYTTACASSMVQKAALAAIEGPQKSVSDMVSEFKRRRDLVVKRLNEMGIDCPQPQGAFYVFPQVNNPDEFIKEGLKVGVVMVNGKAFGIHGETHIRLSYATSYNQLEDAMNRLDSIKFS
jgi:aspartate aminotransferase